MLLRNVPTTNLFEKSRFTAALFVGLSLLLSACSRAPQPLDLSVSDEWREGDLALRCGWGVESRVVTMQGSYYSHIGILHYDTLSAQWQVIHAVPGEDEPEYLKAEPATVFFSTERAQRGAWMRIRCNDTVAQHAVQYALTKVQQHIEFDNNYLLADTAQLYCTELVWQSYLHQGLDITCGRRQTVPTIFSKEGECIFPSTIEESETSLFVKPLKTQSL